MTELIGKDDPRYFSQTCNKPYDRHLYKIVCKNKSVVLESWEEVQEYWWNNMALNPDMIVEVLDKKRGFK
jgi:Uma2 family endonuclease|tara:strand:- start:456 stop:665 length:210 start_codon:yes stop_codon:yes gene_type:complete